MWTALACVARRSGQSRREKRAAKPRKRVGEQSEPRGEWGEGLLPSPLPILLAARFAHRLVFAASPLVSPFSTDQNAELRRIGLPSLCNRAHIVLCVFYGATSGILLEQSSYSSLKPKSSLS